MKTVFAIFIKDMKSNFREFLLIYMIMAPLLLAVGLKFFIPNVNTTGLHFALDEKLPKEVIEEFERYGEVELFSDLTEMEERINAMDEVVGLTVKEDGNYLILMEGNEKENMIPAILQNRVNKEDSQIQFQYRDIGYELSPVASVGGVSIILMAIILSGIVIGLGIIEDKESGTISAMAVTPMSKSQYVIGKSLVGFILTFVHTFLILWILDMLYVHLGMAMLLAMVSFSIALLFGFIIGVTSPNQMAGIATMKILMLPVSASIMGAIFLPGNLQFLVYWSPIYWSYVGFYKIIMGTAMWSQIINSILWIIGLSTVILILFRNKIKQGLV